MLKQIFNKATLLKRFPGKFNRITKQGLRAAPLITKNTSTPSILTNLVGIVLIKTEVRTLKASVNS